MENTRTQSKSIQNKSFGICFMFVNLNRPAELVNIYVKILHFLKILSADFFVF